MAPPDEKSRNSSGDKERRNGDIFPSTVGAHSVTSVTSDEEDCKIDEGNGDDFISPQMIQDQRVKEIERESRSAAKAAAKIQPSKTSAAAGAVEVGNKRNVRQQRYPSRMEKYWDSQFHLESAPNSVPPSSVSARRTSEATTEVAEAETLAAPGAHVQNGPHATEDSSEGRQSEDLLKDEEAPIPTAESRDSDAGHLVEANKVDDADVIIDATDVKKDNFKRKLVVAALFLFCLTLGLGLYFGLQSDAPLQCKFDDPRCCNFADEPLAHLGPLSCYCFNTTELLHEEGDDSTFSLELYDTVKTLFLNLFDESEDDVGMSTEERKALVAELTDLNGDSCHPFDQVFFLFANEGMYMQLLHNARSDTQKRHFILGTLFIFTNGIGWNDSEGWFDDEERSACSWYGLECLFEDHINVIDLWKNNLEGEIPIGMSLFSSLQELDLSGNEYLKGTIPTELENMAGLTELALSGASLTGTIPAGLANLAQLQNLELNANDNACAGLTGTIPPELFDSFFLRNVELGKNALSSSLPTEIGLAINLITLKVPKCGLTGALPSEFGSNTRLQVLDISANRMNGGPIPTELGKLTNLEFLNVANSGLNETIPETFCDNIRSSRGFVVASDCSLGFPLCTCCRVNGDETDENMGRFFIDVTCVDEIQVEESEDCS